MQDQANEKLPSERLLIKGEKATLLIYEFDRVLTEILDEMHEQITAQGERIKKLEKDMRLAKSNG